MLAHVLAKGKAMCDKNFDLITPGLSDKSMCSSARILLTDFFGNSHLTQLTKSADKEVLVKVAYAHRSPQRRES